MKERIFFCCKILFVLFSVNTLAQDTIAKKHELYFGVNIPRLFAKDYELQCAYRVNDKIIMGISAGYDFNAGEKYFVVAKPLDDTSGWKATNSTSIEGETNPSSRYFFGKGIALRFFLDILHLNKKQKQKFYSFEVLWKTRNYDNYYYQEYLVFLESAQQNIFGFTFYMGRYLPLGRFFSLKYFSGFGIRYLRSNVTRPGYTIPYSVEWRPENKFVYKLVIPSLHLGVAVIINTAGKKNKL